MMPGMDFSACLETPYVTKDVTAPKTVAEDLKQSQESLDAASEKLKNPGDPADIILLSYRSMYGAAKALVHRAGYQVTNFRYLLTMLDQLYVRAKKLDKNLLDQLVAAQKLTGNAEEQFKSAQIFLAKVKEIIR